MVRAEGILNNRSECITLLLQDQIACSLDVARLCALAVLAGCTKKQMSSWVAGIKASDFFYSKNLHFERLEGINMKSIEELMNTKRKEAHAYGDYGKADLQRGRRGREISRCRTKEIEKLNKKQPVVSYKIPATGK